MAVIEFNKRQYQTSGELPTEGSALPDFTVVDGSFRDVGIDDFSWQTLVFNIFPSIDTPVCSMSVKKFNEMAVKLDNVVVLCVSADLPFAQKRFCESFSLNNVHPVSSFRGNFGESFGVEITEGPMEGLLARAVVVVDSFGKVRHSQLVKDLINTAVDYERVWEVLDKPYQLD